MTSSGGTRRLALRGLLAGAAAGVVTLATMAMGGAFAATPTVPQHALVASSASQRLIDQLANCRDMQAWALAHGNSSQRTWAANCVAEAQGAINAAGVTPTPSPSTTQTSTPTPAPTTLPPTTTPPATTPPATTAPPTPTPTPTPSPSPTNGTWPDASTTGVPAGYPLTVHGATDVTVAGTVIDGWDIYGWLNIKAPNVTVTNTRVHCAATGECVHAYNADGLRMTRVDVGPDVTNSDPTKAGIAIMDGGPGPATRNVYRGMNLHNVGDGLRCDGGFTLVDSYVHNLGFGGGLHGDGCQATASGFMLFTGNRIDGGNTSVFLIQSNPSGIVIDRNLLSCKSAAGEQTSYITNVGPDVPQGGVVLSNNVLVGPCQAGWDGSSTAYHWTLSNWFGNVDQNGHPIAPPS